MPVISPVLLVLVVAIFAVLKLLPRNRFSQIAQATADANTKN